MNRLIAALALVATLALAGTASAQRSEHRCWVGSAYGGYAYTSDVTSCPFALRVVHQADKNVWRYGPGWFHVNAWSPATGRFYYMNCRATKYMWAVCKGGIGSRVSWWIP